MRASVLVCSCILSILLGVISAQAAQTSGPVPTLVQHVSTQSNGINAAEGPAFYIHLPQPTLPGNILIFGLTHQYSANRTVTITDNQSNAWPSPAVSLDNPGNDVSTKIYTIAPAAGTQDLTITFDAALFDVHFSLSEFYNCATSGTTVLTDGSNGNTNAGGGPTLSAGPITTTTNGDLIWNYAVDTRGGDLGNGTQAAAWIAGDGFTKLAADRRFNTYAQYQIQSAAGLVDPSFTALGTADAFNDVTIAIKPSSTGTAPAGIRIVHEFHFALLPDTPQTVLDVPSSGNLIVPAFSVNSIDGGNNVANITDSQNNAYTKEQPDPNVGQIFHADNATTSTELTLAVDSDSPGFETEVLVYDINGAAASPIDVMGYAVSLEDLQNNAPTDGNLNDAPDITPTTAGGLVIAVLQLGFGPPSSLVPAPGVDYTLTSVWSTNMADASTFNYGEGHAVVFNPDTSPLTFNWTIANGNTDTTGNALAVAFKAASPVQPIAPAITSASSAAFVVGSAGTFRVTATGSPTPTLSESGALPSGVTFTASTGVLSGTPDVGTDGSYPMTFTAQNGVAPDAVQAFTLTVSSQVVVVAPTITCADNATFVVESAGTFTVTATGSPTPVLSESGALPSGVTFTASTGVLSGTPARRTAGSYPITFTAQNGVAPDAVQAFTLTVSSRSAAPAIINASSAAFLVGNAGIFSVTATGSPTPVLSESGALPSGVTFTASPGVLSGTPAVGTAGGYPITFTAQNGVTPDAVQAFTLTVSDPAVNSPPSITTPPASQTVTAGQTATFSVTASGSTPLSYQWSENGVAISGATSSSYTTPPTTTADDGAKFSVTVSNPAGSVTWGYAFLTVTGSTGGTAPAIVTPPASQTVAVGQTATFTVAASGTAPLSYQWGRNGTAISGATSSSYTTPAAASADDGAKFSVTVSNSAGTVTWGYAFLTVTGATTAPPSVTINQAAGQEDPTNGSPINFTAVFSTAVTGFTNAGVTLTGTAGATTAVVTGSGTTYKTTYNVAVSGMTQTGTVIASIAAGAASDLAGNTNTASSSTNNTATYVSASAPFGHVFVVVEENANYFNVIGSSLAPYLNGLANNYGLATQYYANTHPSIGNYFMMTTGQVLTNDDTVTPSTFPVSADNVVRELLAAGKTWKQYAEDLPSVGYVGDDDGEFAAHHAPLSYMTDVQNSPVQLQNLVPFTQFATDLANGTLPNYSFIVPNLCDDAHDCGLNVADSWLSTNIDPLIKSPVFQQDGLLIIVFDESGNDDTNGGGQVVAAVVSPLDKGGYTSTTLYQHQSLLRLTLEALGVHTLPGAAATAPAMWEFFTFSVN